MDSNLEKQSEKNLSKYKRFFIILTIFAILAMCVSYPVPFQISERVIGDSRSDIWTHLWGYWRTEKSFFVDHEFPYFETHLNHPYGGKLYHIDFLNSLFMLPFRFLFGLVAGYNLMVWTHMVLGAMAMYLLARRFVQRAPPAILAGFIYAFSPFMLTFPLASGVSERLNIAWFPFFFLFFFRLLETGKYRYVFGAAVMFVFAASGCWKYGLFLFLLTLFLSIFLLVHPLVQYIFRPLHPTKRLSRHYFDLVVKKLVPLAFCCGLAGLPIVLSASSSVSVVDPEALFKRETSLFWDGQNILGIFNLFTFRDYFAPFGGGLLITHIYDLLYQTVYIGYSLLALGVVSLFSKRKYTLFFFPVAILFLILALGPQILLFRGTEPIHSTIFHLMARVVPFMTALKAPWEFTVPAVFCLALAAAQGFEWLLEKINSKLWQKIAVFEVLLIVLLEMLVISPVIVPVPTADARVPKFYYTIAKETESFAVFDYPIRRTKSEMIPEEYFYYQTVHKKPIPFAVNKGWIDESSFWKKLTWYQQGLINSLPSHKYENAKAVSFLRNNNFKYFILHKALIVDNMKREYIRFFEGMFGEPVFEDSDMIVFNIR